MPAFFDGSTIDIKCPKCGHKFPETIGRLKRDPLLTCPSCRASIRIEGTLESDLKPTEKAKDEYARAVRNLGKPR